MKNKNIQQHQHKQKRGESNRREEKKQKNGEYQKTTKSFGFSLSCLRLKQKYFFQLSALLIVDGYYDVILLYYIF
jgi:hypothetical protein